MSRELARTSGHCWCTQHEHGGAWTLRDRAICANALADAHA